MHTRSSCQQRLKVAVPFAKPGPGAASGPPERICELSVRQLSDTTASAAAMSEGLMPRLEHVRVGRDGLPLPGTTIIAAISCAEQVNRACVHLLNEGTRALRGGGCGGSREGGGARQLVLWRVWASQGRPPALSLRHLPEIINKYTARSAGRRAPPMNSLCLRWQGVCVCSLATDERTHDG